MPSTKASTVQATSDNGTSSISLENGKPATQVEVNKIKRDFKKFLRPLQTGSITVRSSSVFFHNESQILPRDAQRSGSRLASDILFLDGQYRDLVQAEINLIDLISLPQFKALAAHKLPYISLNPFRFEFPGIAEQKIVRALDSDVFVALHHAKGNAADAAKGIKESIAYYGRQIVARSYSGDTQKAWPKKLRLGVPVVAGLTGSKLGQFDEHEFFGHFNLMTEEKGLLYVVQNTNGVNPQVAFSDSLYAEYRKSIWHLLKTVAQDSSFDATSPYYFPRRTESGVEHTYIFDRATSVTIDGECFPIPQNTVAVTGMDRRPAPDEITQKAKDADMSVVRIDNRLDQTYAFWIKGRQFTPPVHEGFFCSPSPT
ncbi:MAG: hypothetical protein AB7H77_04570 [Bdellovibrionales bacterium]